MKLHSLFFVMALAVTACLPGCRSVEDPGAGALILLDKNSVSNTVLLQTGGFVRLSLVENGTTGYRWKFHVTGEAVQITKDEFEAPNNGLCGAPGIRKIYLRAMKPGKVQVEAELRRPWEKDQPPAEKLVYSLRVID